MRQGRIRSHQAFSVEIPNLAATLQRQNTPSLCFPAPKPTSFGFRSRNPLSFYFFPSPPTKLVSSQIGDFLRGLLGGFPSPPHAPGPAVQRGAGRTLRGVRAHPAEPGGPSRRWVLPQPWGTPQDPCAGASSQPTGAASGPTPPPSPRRSCGQGHRHRRCCGASWN